jgi:hypothetical protein
MSNKNQIIEAQENKQSFFSKLMYNVKMIMYYAAMWLIVIAFIILAYRVLVIKNNGHAINYKTMTASIDELRATEENERKMYEINAFNFYSQTYSSKVAKRLALADAEKYSASKTEARNSDSEIDEQTISQIESSKKEGGFLRKMAGDAAASVVNKVYNAFEFGDKNSEAYGNDSYDLQKQSDEDLVAMLKPKKKQLNTPQSSLPSGIGGGRKAILTSELHDKNE